jgi:hypothetical protein
VGCVYFFIDKYRYFCESIGMKNTQALQRRIKEIQRELAELGSMRPGSLSEQYNVCGTPGCRCKDPKKPQKHGPYYHLNYTWRGRSRTEFVKAEDVEGVGEQLSNYKRFRALCTEWVDVSLELARLKKEKRSG